MRTMRFSKQQAGKNLILNPARKSVALGTKLAGRHVGLLSRISCAGSPGASSAEEHPEEENEPLVVEAEEGRHL